jgi:hypothetical protein
MMTMIRRLAILSLFLMVPVGCLAQDDDFGFWLGANVSHSLSKKIDAELSGCVRTFKNTSQIEQSFIEGGIQYSFSKYISLSGSYRLTSNLEDDSKYYFRHKIFFDLKAGFPVGNFSFSGRARIQRASKTYIENDSDLDPEYTLRLKLKAIYNISAFPLKPYIYYEPFIPVFADSAFEIGKNRFSFGSELKITARSSINMEYIFQRDYQPHIADINIISISYDFKF